MLYIKILLFLRATKLKMYSFYIVIWWVHFVSIILFMLYPVISIYICRHALKKKPTEKRLGWLHCALNCDPMSMNLSQDDRRCFCNPQGPTWHGAQGVIPWHVQWWQPCISCPHTIQFNGGEKCKVVGTLHNIRVIVNGYLPSWLCT
jgi:hypothetical protein